MGYYNENWVDDTILEFPKMGFWLVHVLGGIFLFWLGMRFSFRRMPLPMIVFFRLMRMIR